MHINLKKFWQKIVAFIKSIFDSDSDPEPTPTPEPTPIPTPDPQPQPKPDPKPVPKPAKVVNPDKVVVWNEQSPANDYGMGGDVIARSGMIRGRTWRLLHGLYDAVPKDPAAYVKAAANEGAKGVAIDVEGDFNNAYNLRAFRSACDKFGVKLIGAPKVTCNPGGSYPGSNFEKSVQLFQDVFDAVLVWGYGCDGGAYDWHIQRWRDAGFTKQIGVFQDQVRDTNGYMGKVYWRDCVKHAQAGEYPFVLLLPNHSSAALLAELRKMYS